ncbi:hypothetical protein PUN28_006368 [Cardiocondyla obscurior]|uniref:Photosystem I assembly protein Ycf4 n=1 Tax=Cardiocondyla obscurior TaxID=286306 RepID=A0AAW2GA36_9HYME
MSGYFGAVPLALFLHLCLPSVSSKYWYILIFILYIHGKKKKLKTYPRYGKEIYITDKKEIFADGAPNKDRLFLGTDTEMRLTVRFRSHTTSLRIIFLTIIPTDWDNFEIRTILRLLNHRGNFFPIDIYFGSTYQWILQIGNRLSLIFV